MSRGPSFSAGLWVCTFAGILSGPAAGGGLPIAQYDALSAYVPEQNAAVWLVETSTIDIPLFLSEPPAGSASVFWNSQFGMTPSFGTTPFVGTTASYTLTFPGTAGEAFYPGWLAWPGLTYFGSGTNIEVGEVWTLWLVRVQELGPAPREGPGKDCFWTWACLLSARAYLPAFCNLGLAAAGSDATTILTRYRDEVLATTSEGQYYTGLYQTHSLDMMRAATGQPDFLARGYRTMGPWVAAFDALVDGNGSSAIVTAEMQAGLLDLLDTFEASGSPALAGAVAEERVKLQLDTIAGLTMSEFQTRVETLGGPSAVDAHSWGRLKTLYR